MILRPSTKVSPRAFADLVANSLVDNKELDELFREIRVPYLIEAGTLATTNPDVGRIRLVLADGSEFLMVVTRTK